MGKTKTKIESIHEERLAVDTAGMRQLHAGRPAWSLVKELIQNAWDEAPEATICHVVIYTENDETTIEVSDDGSGFNDIRDAYTLMRETGKRSDPAKRGRFNIGEKEIVSVALEASVETVGQTVVFPRAGGRRIETNDRERGTTVRVTMPWDGATAESVKTMLRRFRPTDCRLLINDFEVPQRLPLESRDVTLETVLQSGPGQPMRRTERKTTIDIMDPFDGSGWLYEMGIPIQETELAYDVDIQQKVPMPPNRDTVGDAYLRRLSAEVLNGVYSFMNGDEFAEAWVRTALGAKQIKAEAVQATMVERYGDKVALWSSNPDANMKAAEAGFEVLHPRSMAPDERNHMRSMGGLKTTNDLFGRRGIANPAEPIDETDAHSGFAEFVRSIAETLHLDATIRFVKQDTNVVASCSAATRTPIVTFNTQHLSDAWFAERGASQVELIVHELAHACANTPMEHGPKWGDACAAIAGILAVDGI